MTTIDIAELPVAEKLMLMEKLWDALALYAGEVPADNRADRSGGLTS